MNSKYLKRAYCPICDRFLKDGDCPKILAVAQGEAPADSLPAGVEPTREQLDFCRDFCRHHCKEPIREEYELFDCPIRGLKLNGYDCMDLCFVAEDEWPETMLPHGFDMTNEKKSFCMCCKEHPDLRELD